MSTKLIDVAGRPYVAPIFRTVRRVRPNPDRRAYYAAPTFDPTRNARANPNRSYGYSTISDSLVIEYGPRIFDKLGKPRGNARFA